jgi:tripartite-type tricarboxylate transporter receptor subunit TctC
MRQKSRIGLALAAVLLNAAANAALAADPESVEDFYKGRPVSVIITGSSGSIYDMYARTITQYMTRYIPGNPTFVPRSMIGGGHLVGTNYLYNVAPRDGSVIGSIGETMPLTQMLEPQSAKFDASKFYWIGNPNVANLTLAVWSKSGVQTLQDAMRREVIIGASGANSPSAQTPTLLNNTLGAKFKIVNGFPANQIDLAMERGEVDGRGSAQWHWWKFSRADWVRDRKINILVQIGPAKDPDLPNVPLLTDLARNASERQIFNLFSSTVAVGRPLLAPPGAPPARVAALRKAFMEVMKDPEFQAEARRLNLQISPMFGEELQAEVASLIATPKDVVERARSALGLTKADMAERDASPNEADQGHRSSEEGR